MESLLRAYRPCCAAKYCFKVCFSAVVPRLSCLSAAQPLLVAAEHVQGRAAKRRGQKSLVLLHMTGHAQSSFKQVSEHLSQTSSSIAAKGGRAASSRPIRQRRRWPSAIVRILQLSRKRSILPAHRRCPLALEAPSLAPQGGPPGRMPAATCPPTPAGPALPPFCPARWPA